LFEIRTVNGERTTKSVTPTRSVRPPAARTD
jgi:hypothetical protein